MSRTAIYNIIKSSVDVPVYMSLDVKNIKNDCIILEKLSNINSINSSISGWEQWAAFIYSPSNPLHLDRIAEKVIQALHKNGYEVQITGGDDWFDTDANAYVTSVSCRVPKVYF